MEFVKQFFEKQGKTIFSKEKRQKNCRKKARQKFACFPVFSKISVQKVYSTTTLWNTFLPFLIMVSPFKGMIAFGSVTFSLLTETPPCCTNRRASPLEAHSPAFTIRVRMPIPPSCKSAAGIAVVGIFSLELPLVKIAFAASCAWSAASFPCTSSVRE